MSAARPVHGAVEEEHPVAARLPALTESAAGMLFLRQRTTSTWTSPRKRLSLLEALGLAELTHDARHNRMRAL